MKTLLECSAYMLNQVPMHLSLVIRESGATAVTNQNPGSRSDGLLLGPAALTESGLLIPCRLLRGTSCIRVWCLHCILIHYSGSQLPDKWHHHLALPFCPLCPGLPLADCLLLSDVAANAVEPQPPNIHVWLGGSPGCGCVGLVCLSLSVKSHPCRGTRLIEWLLG